MPYSPYKEYIVSISDDRDIEIEIEGKDKTVVVFHNVQEVGTGKYITIASDGKKVWELYSGRDITNSKLGNIIKNKYRQVIARKITLTGRKFL